jgi:dTDP-glucose 4,6-dehydratase
VLLLGGSGFIGGWMTRSLAGGGAHIYAVARSASGAERARCLGAATVRVADLTKPGAVATAVREAAPAVIFNMAGYGVDHSERDSSLMSILNTDLVVDLCAAATRVPDASGWGGLRLVHAGSALEYGPVSGRISEETEPIPNTDYGRTKLAGSKAVIESIRHAGVPAAVVRLFTVYGPGEHEGRLLPSLMGAARTGGEVNLSSGEQPRDFTYVEDAVAGLLRAGCSAAASGVLNVATGQLTTVRQFVEQAAEILGIAEQRLRFGRVPPRTGEMFHGVVDTSLARRVLGWVPGTSVGEGIRRTWELERN